jgi:cyclohexyl-isocyanide hydratase
MSFRVGFLLYPDVTQLDMTGPAQVLSRLPGAVVDYAWKRIEPVMSDCNLALMPTVTLDDAPQFDLLCVPGGYGCTAMMGDAAVLDWLRGQAAGARYVTSVCTGSLVLAAAGLLRGYRAGCHWAWGEHLAKFGAEFVRERVVVDRNRISAGGVTSGIDFAFRVLAEMHGQDLADTVRLGLEYDPDTARGGTPATARPEILAAYERAVGPRIAERARAVDAVAERFADGAQASA